MAELSQFNAEAYPVGQRLAAWRGALEPAHLRASEILDAALGHGSLIRIKTRSHSQFVRVAGGAQSLSWRNASRPGDLWLAAVIEGTGHLPGGHIAPQGSLIVGSMAVGGGLSFRSRFRLLFVHLPAEATDPRLRRMSIDGDRPLEARGLSQVLTHFLQSIAEQMEALDARTLHPLELCLSEMLVATLTESIGNQAVAPANRRRSSFQRVVQAIEAGLTDADLTLESLAGTEGLSPRAIQKLFRAEQLTFSQYLRRRRLERAAQELLDPLRTDTMVAEIGFRWGFTDPAHFSRAFREQYGTTPSLFREQAEAPAGAALDNQETRGRPHRTAPLPEAARAARPAEPADLPLEPSASANARDAHSARHHLPISRRTVHWGYFSRALAPVLTVKSGDTVTVEALTQHATDDYNRMVLGDPGAESVVGWTKEVKNVDRRGAGPMDASIYGRGAGEGFGVHICSGPIAVDGATPGDVLEIEILDIVPRPSQSPGYEGRSFGSNAAVWWGFHYKDLLTEPRPRETVTLYEISKDGPGYVAAPVYSYQWVPQTDPDGVLHPTIDYPGIPVDHATIDKNYNALAGVRLPIRPHFGIIALASDFAGLVDSTPPSSFGGNIDNWRLGVGSRLYLPVAVTGGLLSIGDPHASQGDGEVSGTAIECSLTGTFLIRLHPRRWTRGLLRDLTYPLIETADAWVVQGFSHPNYLAELGASALSDVYKRSTLDGAMRDAFRKARRLLMVGWGLSEDEAISLLSVGVDFAVTQVVDGNLGIHAVIPKAILPRRPDAPPHAE
ncbi:MAG: helix-turn-helix domain-containing protein [Proteobacteria bacterium]|nr:helix-turn-helix domain-containing protein [Pseudomonadota bacterium]